MTGSLDKAREVARTRFGIERLHPEQEKGIAAVVAGRDAVCVLPTGYGKSLIYQLPATLLGGPTVAISPLIALMRDQEKSLRNRGVPVVRIDSTLKKRSRDNNLRRIAKGGPLVVLTTPETLERQDAREAFASGKPQLLCVDEAHCITEWGHDFRPSYLRIGAEREKLAIPQTLALTATATPKVREHIADRLRMIDHAEVAAPPHRQNLRLSVHDVPGNRKIERIGRLLDELRRPGVIYCATKKAVDEMYGALSRSGIPSARYHGGMTPKERTAAQRKYMKRGRLVMVATSAFGMGIDKSNIRYIAHYQVPGSLEQYIQEAGRAGRDGEPSECVLLYDSADLDIQRHLQQQSRPTRPQLARIAEALSEWADKGEPADAKTLAEAASIPVTTCRALCAQLEDIGLIVLDGERQYVGRASPEAIRQGADDLAARYEIYRQGDAQRLAAVRDYATGQGCRSAAIRRWFGEPEPPVCGRCDRCTAQG